MLPRIKTGLIILALLCPVSASAQRGQLPAEIKAIQDKMVRREKVTPEEQKKFDDYMNGLMEKLQKLSDTPTVLKPKSPSSALSLPADPLLPKSNPSVHLAAPTRPTPGQYLALVKTIHADAEAKLTAAERQRLDAAIQKFAAAPGKVADLGMYELMAGGAGKTAAALYLLTAGAMQDQAAATASSNLGVVLKNAGYYESSLPTLLYAESLAPSSSIIEANLGWTIAYLGDFQTARAQFQKALGINGGEVSALEGLGILARVEGNVAETAKYLRRRLMLGYSSVAARHLSMVEQKANATNVLGLTDASLESTPGMRLADVIPYPHSTAAGAGNNQKLELPDAPDFYSSSPAYVSKVGRGAFEEYRNRLRAEIKAGLNELESARSAVGPLRPKPLRSGDTVVFRRGYEYEAFALRDAEHVFARRHQKLYNDFYRRFSDEIVGTMLADKVSAARQNELREVASCGGDNECQQAAARRFCRASVDAVKAAHPAFYSVWENYYRAVREDLKRYYALTSPWIRAIGDPVLNRYENLRRENFIRMADPAEREVWLQWANAVQGNWGDCAPEPPPQRQRNDLRHALKVFPEPYGDCHVWTGSFDGGIAAINATCDTLKLKFRAGAIELSSDTKFGPTERDDQTTFRIGTGVSKDASGTVAGGEVGLNADYYVTMQNGNVIDHGTEYLGKLEVTVGNSGEGILEGKLPTATMGQSVSVRVSAVSGAHVEANDEPDVDFGGIGSQYMRPPQ